jgi:hypothetical protein
LNKSSGSGGTISMCVLLGFWGWFGTVLCATVTPGFRFGVWGWLTGFRFRF